MDACTPSSRWLCSTPEPSLDQRVVRGQPRSGTIASTTTASILTAVVGLGGCGGEADRPATGAEAGAPVTADNILRVAYTREIDLLNPFTSQNLVDIQFSMMEGLITTDDSNTYIPVLAREIPTEANGQIIRNDDGTLDITWRLHEGVRWHDGEPLTSEDVCFTWEFVASPGSQTYNRDQYLSILECSMPDEHTVVMRWDGVRGYYAGLFEALLPQHVFAGMSTEDIVNHEPFNRGSATIGTGPFRFAEWRSGEYIRVVKNDDYWRGDPYPHIESIVWSFIPDSNTRLNALRTGRHHWGQIEPTQVDEMQGQPGYDVRLVSSNSVMHLDLAVNTERGELLFSDARVRKAIFHAIDRPAIAEQLMEGTVRVTDTPVNPTSPYHNPDVFSYDFDPARSATLFDEAGWRMGPDGIREKDGTRLAFTMINRSGMQDRLQVAQVIQAQLRDVGVDVTFETLESAAWTQKWRSGDWEAIVSAWFLPADPSLTGLYSCGGPNNMTGLCDPGLDEVLEESDRHLAFADRKPVLDRAQAMLSEAALSLPLYHNVIPEVVSDQIGNYKGSGTNFGSFWNLYEWTLSGASATARSTDSATEITPVALPAAVMTTTPDGVTLHGVSFTDGVAADAPLVLLFHQGGSSARGEYADLGPWLNDQGYRAIAWDLRSGGDRHGAPNRTVDGLIAGVGTEYCDAAADLQAALDHSIDSGWADRAIVWGSSFSAALAVRLAADNPETVSAVLAFSPAGGGPLLDCRARERIAEVVAPVIVFRPGSEMEMESSVEQQNALVQAGADFVVIDNGVHGSSMLVDARTGHDMSAERARVADWLRGALRQSP